MKEIIGKRTVCTKLYDLGGGKRRLSIREASPLHYRDAEGRRRKTIRAIGLSKTLLINFASARNFQAISIAVKPEKLRSGFLALAGKPLLRFLRKNKRTLIFGKSQKMHGVRCGL